jgi:hypothetical protein
VRRQRECPAHGKRATRGSEQIPELAWFEADVNAGVELLYAYADSDRQRWSELEDRVYVTDDRDFQMDIRFQFTNLSRGTMWLRWGDKADAFPEPDRTSKGSPDCPVIKFPKQRDDLRLYKHFCHREEESLLGSELIRSSIGPMVSYLEVLQHQVMTYLSAEERILSYKSRPLIANGKTSFRDVVTGAIGELKNDLQSLKPTEDVSKIYYGVLTHFVSQIPTTAYCVTYDAVHPAAPVRPVRWEKNWLKVCKTSKEAV